MKSELCSDDRLYIKTCSEYIAGLDGMLVDELERRTNSNYPSRFIVKWLNIPQIRLDDWKHMINKNTNVRTSFIHFTRGELVIDCWKNNKKPKKRSREPDTKQHTFHWDLKDVAAPHKKKMSTFLTDIGNMLECQCNATIEHKQDVYECSITLYEPLHYQAFQDIQQKHKDIVQDIVIKIPKNNIVITINI